MCFLPESKLLNDAWFVSMYVAIAYLFYQYKNDHLARMAFCIAIVRAAYNLAIMVGAKTYNSNGTELILGIMAVLILITWRK